MEEFLSLFQDRDVEVWHDVVKAGGRTGTALSPCAVVFSLLLPTVIISRP